MPENQDPPRDPLDLDNVDRQIRINELEEQVSALGGTLHETGEECPSEIKEQFLKHIIDWENGPLGTEMEELAKEGVKLPPPEEVSDADLHDKLWALIHALAARNTFLHHTDHMSDRQLYERLWNDSLREVNPIMPKNSGWNYHIDFISSGSEEDTQIGLRYYDSEEDRQRWARDFPNTVIPPHEDLPYDRDRLLPQAKYEALEMDGDFDPEEGLDSGEPADEP